MILNYENAIILADNWLQKWNHASLDDILKLYSEDIELVSNMALQVVTESKGKIAGKHVLKNYWAIIKDKYPNIKFEMKKVELIENKIIIFLRTTDKNFDVIAKLSVNDDGLISKLDISYL